VKIVSKNNFSFVLTFNVMLNFSLIKFQLNYSIVVENYYILAFLGNKKGALACVFAYQYSIIV